MRDLHWLSIQYLMMGAVILTGPPASAEELVKIVLETEDFNLSPPMVSTFDPSVSNGKYISVPNDAGEGGSAEIDEVFPQDAEYVVYGRVHAPTGGDNSFVVFVDGNRSEWHLSTTGAAWTWQQLTHRGTDGIKQEVRLNLSAGTHTLKIARREDGTEIDQLIVTNDRNFLPSGLETSWITFEAESATLTAPMAISSIDQALGGQYISVPQGTGNSSGGKAGFIVEVTQAGNYHVWARVHAPTGGDNSVFVEIDGQRNMWSIPPRKGWKWRRFDNLYPLTPGPHASPTAPRQIGGKRPGNCGGIPYRTVRLLPKRLRRSRKNF